MTLRNFLLAMTVAVLMGAAPLFEKMSLREASPLTVFTVRSVLMSVFLCVLCFFYQGVRPVLEMSGRTLLYIVIPAVLATAFVLIYFSVLKNDLVSRVVPIISMSPLFAAVFSILFLAEPFSWKRLVGAILIVSGLLLVK